MAKRDGYYILVVQGGEIDIRGPFDSFEKRDKAAKRLWKRLRKPYDNLFFMDCEGGDTPVVGSYMDGELERFYVEGHCVLDGETSSPRYGDLCVADCLDAEWENIRGTRVSEKRAEAMARRICKLLNEDEARRNKAG